jgi:hypothetical protein
LKETKLKVERNPLREIIPRGSHYISYTLGKKKKRRVLLENVQIFTRLRLRIIDAQFVQQFARYVKREGGFGAVETLLGRFAGGALGAALPLLLLLFAVLTQPDLLENADEQLVHVVLQPARRLDEFAVQ